MKKTLLLLCCSLLLLASLAAAETRYVIDTLIITVRDSKGADYQTLGTLPTASPVEILEEDGNFVKVRTEKGLEGYVLRQYLSKATPKKLVISRLEHENAELQNRLNALQEDCREQTTTAQTSLDRLQNTETELKTAQRQLATVTKEFASLKERSQNVVAISEERDRLSTENAALTEKLTVISEENQSLHSSNMIQWFLAGGGVFFGGWLIGKVSRKKRGFSHL